MHHHNMLINAKQCTYTILLQTFYSLKNIKVTLNSFLQQHFPRKRPCAFCQLSNKTVVIFNYILHTFHFANVYLQITMQTTHGQ